MNHLILWLPPELAGDVGWTLIHFLWQGLALAGLLYVALPMCRSAASRHDCALGTLAMMGLAPVLTYLIIRGHAEGGAALVGAPGLLAVGTVTGGNAAAATLHPALLVWLVAFWLAGVAVLSLRAVGGWCLTETWRHLDTIPLPVDLQRRCRNLQRRLALTRPVQFLQSRRVRVPMVVGWFKPVILVPVSAVTGLPVEQLDALILHELAHIMRLDAFANVMQVAVETILFYHPAVWWVGRHIRAEREHCCDDIAVSACGDVSIYVEALISLESGRQAPQLGLAATGGKLKERVRRLLERPADSRRSSFSALVGLALLGLVLAPVATAESAAVPAGHQTVSIRVVDEMFAPDLQPVPQGDDRILVAEPGAGGAHYLWLKRAGQIGGDVFAEAHVGSDPNGRPIIDFTFTPQAGAQFQKLTRENVGRRFAIVVNNRVIMAPVIREPILGEKGQIDGRFATKAEARALIAEMMGTGQSSFRQ
jgi:bla regulator protein blaR1